MTNPVREATDAVGGVSATARALKISRPLVHKWLQAGRVPMARQCVLLAALSGVPAWRLAGLDSDPKQACSSRTTVSG